MRRVSPFALRRKPRPIVEHTFTDPDAPGEEVTLWLQPLDAPTVFLSSERAQELIETYIDGYTDQEGYAVPAIPFPDVDGEPVRVSKSLLQTVCRLEAMQAPQGPHGEPREVEAYNAEELVAIAVCMPTAWGDILEWSSKVNGAEAQKRPNASGAATETCSESPSDTIGGTP